MLSHRIIARLDIKGPNVVKGIHFEGLRIVGKPAILAERYANQGAHEILYIDTVASLYGRNQLETLIQETSERVFVPITVGGGIADCESVNRLLRAGADKVAINTAALKRPELIRELAQEFGSQAITVSIQAKRNNGEAGEYYCYAECGRERAGQDVRDWAAHCCELGAGEILITSIDRDGTLRGPDLELIAALKDLPVPIVYGGGIGSVSDSLKCIGTGADAIAIASALHYDKLTIGEIDSLMNTGTMANVDLLRGISHGETKAA